MTMRASSSLVIAMQTQPAASHIGSHTSSVNQHSQWNLSWFSLFGCDAQRKFLSFCLAFVYSLSASGASVFLDSKPTSLKSLSDTDIANICLVEVTRLAKLMAPNTTPEGVKGFAFASNESWIWRQIVDNNLGQSKSQDQLTAFFAIETQSDAEPVIRYCVDAAVPYFSAAKQQIGDDKWIPILANNMRRIKADVDAEKAAGTYDKSPYAVTSAKSEVNPSSAVLPPSKPAGQSSANIGKREQELAGSVTSVCGSPTLNAVQAVTVARAAEQQFAEELAKWSWRKDACGSYIQSNYKGSEMNRKFESAMTRLNAGKGSATSFYEHCVDWRSYTVDVQEHCHD